MSDALLSPPSQGPIAHRLQSLVALITGAAGNIGFETARRFLLEGARVVLVDLDADRLTKAADTLRKEVQGTDDVILSVQADVTEDADVQRFVNETIQAFGRLNVAFLCAGISYTSTSILETDVDQYDKVMRVNCRSGRSRFYFPIIQLSSDTASLPRGQVLRRCNETGRPWRQHHSSLLHRRPSCDSWTLCLFYVQVRSPWPLLDRGRRVGPVQDPRQHCPSLRRQHAHVPRFVARGEDEEHAGYCAAWALG